MKKRPLFRGCGTALVTPFCADLSVDFETLGRLIEDQVSGGADALIVCGTTGESATLSDREKDAVIEYAVWKTAGRIPVIAGTGSNDTFRSVTQTRAAQRLGADGVLAVCPYYNKPDDEGLLRHFRTVAECSDLPVILYNVPSRTGKALSAPLVAALAEHENVVGIKQADPSLAAAGELFASCGDLPVYAGDDGATVPFFSLGAKGVISVVSNVLPGTVHGLCADWFAGRHARARETQLALIPLIKALFAQTNPIPVKAALEQIGCPPQPLRLPLTSATFATRRRLQEALTPWLDA